MSSCWVGRRDFPEVMGATASAVKAEVDAPVVIFPEGRDFPHARGRRRPVHEPAQLPQPRPRYPDACPRGPGRSGMGLEAIPLGYLVIAPECGSERSVRSTLVPRGRRRSRPGTPSPRSYWGCVSFISRRLGSPRSGARTDGAGGALGALVPWSSGRHPHRRSTPARSSTRSSAARTGTITEEEGLGRRFPRDPRGGATIVAVDGPPSSDTGRALPIGAP